MDMLKGIGKLVSLPGVTGGEAGAGAGVRECFSEFTGQIFSDRLGNVYARIGDEYAKPTVLLMAHMDEIGMMVTQIEENGMLRVCSVAGVDPRVLPGSEVVIHGSKPITGVVGAIPPHLIQQGETEAYKIQDLTVDTGYPLSKVKKMVSVGDFVTFAPAGPLELKNGYISAKTLDDRALVIVLCEVMELLKNRRLSCNVVCCASVQEERGGIGATLGAYNINPDIAVAIDVTHGLVPGDTPEATHPMDKLSIARGSNIHEGVFSLLRDSAKECNIGYDVGACAGETGTDAWEIQVERGGIPTGLISVPLRYMHTSVETVSLDTLKNCAKVLAHFIAAISPDWEEKLCLQD